MVVANQLDLQSSGPRFSTNPLALSNSPVFNEIDHSYSWNDFPLPGVSKVLGDTGLRPEFDRTWWKLSLIRKGMSDEEAEEEMDRVRDEGQRRGSLVHHGIELAIESGDLFQVEEQQPEIIRQYMPHFNAFAEECGLGEVRLVEESLVHPTGFYCGTVDCLAEVGGELMVLDWKTVGKPRKRGKPKAEKWQLAQLTAYLGAINANQQEVQVLSAANVYIFPNGYFFHRWTTDQIVEQWRDLQGLMRDYWIERRDKGQDYHHPECAAIAVETIEARWGPFEPVADDWRNQPLIPD